MPDILQDFPINAPQSRVFEAVSTPCGLDSWWTVRSQGSPSMGTMYDLWFGPEYHWRGEVTRLTHDVEFELRLVRADADWTGTSVGFHLEERAGRTWLAFRHTDWPNANEHYRISNHCWAMYLRILRRSLEFGESVEYHQRLNA